MAEAPARPRQPPSRPTVMTSQEVLDRVKTCHDEAYLYIEQALCCDEHGQKQQALSLYSKGLESVNTALQHANNIPRNARTGPLWESTQQRLTKLEKTKLQIEYRLKDLSKHETSESVEPPPAYDVATSDSIMDDPEEATDGMQLESADELLRIPDGVQTFYITPDGMVSAPSYPTSLSIFKFTDGSTSNVPPAFLKVGNWVYPLSHGASPALQANSGAYVFPDLERGEGKWLHC